LVVATPIEGVQKFLGASGLAQLKVLVLNGPFEDWNAVADLVSSCAALAGLRRLEFGEEYAELERALHPGMSRSRRRLLTERFGERVFWRAGEFAELDVAPDRADNQVPSRAASPGRLGG
jgi:hypothetical protein